ncbi:hypothetical protein DPEC_G00314630 [Dallia pectoralis]|uniref:Uncharacterized protein n=1 Tax=Dallia pectoralis TaxID=75939 RepID=A0ACC2FC85_DALPE|nr:hypothetical protein DPEC_G00314630 [Dallia pectoralis]
MTELIYYLASRPWLQNLEEPPDVGATYVTFVHHASTRICIGTVKIKYRMAGNCLSSSHMNTVDNEKLVQPNDKLHNILLEAGAVKQILTMKEVAFGTCLHVCTASGTRQCYLPERKYILTHDVVAMVESSWRV